MLDRSNIYAYGNGNPISNVDPDGLQSVLPGMTPPPLILPPTSPSYPSVTPPYVPDSSRPESRPDRPDSRPDRDDAGDCPRSAAGGGRWTCTAQCNVQVIDTSLDGKVPGRVTGSGTGKTEPDACDAAKKDAVSSAPVGTYARHCKCSCSKK
jgi:hypothetical protein